MTVVTVPSLVALRHRLLKLVACNVLTENHLNCNNYFPMFIRLQKDLFLCLQDQIIMTLKKELEEVQQNLKVKEEEVDVHQYLYILRYLLLKYRLVS